MRVELLKNTSNTNSINRSFSKTTILEGVLKEGSDILSPVILCDFDYNPADYNMMHIPAFNRYYFVHLKNVRATLWEVIADDVDVLYSNKDAILNLNAIIDKQENNYNQYINDGSYVSELDTFPEVKVFSSGFNDNGQFILITAGGNGGVNA